MIGKKLKDLRISLKITQAELSERSGLRQATISDIENDRADFFLKTLEKIVSAMGYSLEFIFKKQ